MNTHQITTSVELITPEKAGEYLSHRGGNRPLDSHRLDFYTYLMTSGKWGFDPSSDIVFSEDGTLLNGQHRLEAVIKSGVASEFMVKRGADKASRIYMDTGKPRNGSDALAIAGYPNGVRISAIINFLLGTIRKGTMPQGDGTSKGKVRSFVTNESILEEYETSPDLYQMVSNLAYGEYKKHYLFSTTHFGSVCVYLVKDKHHDLAKVKEFYELLNDCSREAYPYLAFLRSRIDKARGGMVSIKDKFPIAQRLVMLSKAWNYFLVGEDRKVIVCRPGDKMQFD